MRRHGFRILGPVDGARRLVNARAALAAYAACDERAQVESEAYLSAFHFGDDFRDYLAEHRSTKGFRGACGADFIYGDVDRQGKPDEALRDARALALYMVDRYGLTDDEILIFFTGSKGYHVGIPTALWSPEPCVGFNAVTKTLMTALAAHVPGGGVGIDGGVYSVVQAFRAPNSRHAKTGLHKRRLSLNELLHWGAARIAEVAAHPEPFDLPRPSRRCEQAAVDWADATAQVARLREALDGCSKEKGGARLTYWTLDFIRNGAPPGGEGAPGHAGRHRRLFSAAANLAEFGCPATLAHALLAPAARDSGLAPRDAARQIDNGLKHGSTPHGT